MRLTEEQRALRAAVGDLVDRRSNVRAVIDSPTGFDAQLWRTLCGEIGVAGLHVPAEYGGAGAGLAETCVVTEELGRTLTPTPLLGSAVLAGTALLASGNAEACARLLPAIAAGTSLAALAVGELSTSDYLTGVADYVLDGDLADILLVATSDGLFEVPVDQPGVHRTAVTTMDQTRRLATVELVNATGRRIGTAAAAATAFDAARVVLAAEQVGAAAECLRRTVAYSKQRVQFGRPIGGFQALQHRMADVYVAVETARAAVRAAAEADDPTRAAVASVYCGEVFQLAAAEMIQLHGGIAITWEHDAHLFLKRAHGSAHLFPTPPLAGLAGIGELAGPAGGGRG
ncbi:MAG TPA: acyl-CoA dehydrogenase family protein [Pseudonocardiaceae bacterium]